MMSDADDNISALLAELLTLPGERRLARLRESAGAAEGEATKLTDALVSLGDEAERLAVVEVSRALSASELSVSLADEADAPRARARARRARGQALAYAGRFDEALGLCAEAERIANAHGETIEAARAKIAAIHPLTELGRFDEAVLSGEAAHASLSTLDQTALAARADINLGRLHQHRDNPHLALIHLDRARQALRQEPWLLAHVDNNRGEAMLTLGNFADAEAAFLAALRTFQEIENHLAAAVVEGNLADLAARQGMLQRALHHFERARQALEGNQAPSHLARLLAEQAEVIAALGLPADALESYRQVVPRLSELGCAWEEGRAQTGLAQILMALDRTDEAKAALNRALDRFVELKNPTAAARVRILQGVLAGREDRCDSALELLENAAQSVQDRPFEAAVARFHQARIQSDRGDLQAATRLIRESHALASSLDVAPLLADVVHARGQLHRKLGRQTDAIRDFRESVSQTERVRGSLQAERFRAAFLGDRLAPYEDLVRALLDQGGPDALADAFSIVEKVKSRSLLDLVRGALDSAEHGATSSAAAAPMQQPPGEAPLVAELARLRRELNALYSRLSIDGRSGERKLVVRHWRDALHQRETDFERALARLSSMQGLKRRGLAELYADPVGVEEALQLVDEGGALVEYFAAHEELMAFVITPDEQVIVRGLGTRSELNERVARVQFQLRRGLHANAMVDGGNERLRSDVRRELLSLWRMVFAPLTKKVGDASRVFIVPHGPLHLVPFHALWDGQRFLLEQHEFVYGPSASVLAHTAKTDETRQNVRRSLVIGVADEFAPRIEAEARTVAEILDAQNVLLNGAATTGQFLATAADANVIHLACHGRFSAVTPLASGFKLSDRWLTARELYNLRLNADLVTLSGCETGKHLVASGDEILGLVRGFLAAGAASLLVSLWTANDESTAEMMGRFYELWHGQDSRGLGKAGALRQAQLEAIARWPHPASWAPFVLVGRS